MSKSFIGLKELHCLECGVILDMTRVQMQGKLHCEVIMCWNRIGTLALIVSTLPSSSHSRRPATPFTQAATHIVCFPVTLIRTTLLRHG
jgi:hypothetical protein